MREKIELAKTTNSRTATLTVHRRLYVCLILVLVLGCSILFVSVVARAKGAACSATAPGIDFSIGFVSILYFSIRHFSSLFHRREHPT